MSSAAKPSIVLLSVLAVAAPAVRAQVYPPAIDLSRINGTNGSFVNGETVRHWAGSSVSTGDVNGDGLDDLIVAATPFDDPIIDTIPGRVYVVFGTDAGLPLDLDLADLDGTNGFELVGANNGDRFGLPVAAGDFNNDGFDDVLIGAPTARPFLIPNAGRAHIILGHASPFDPMIEINEETIAELGFTIQGFAAGMQVGSSVAMADLNDDGNADAIIGAAFADPGGRSNAGQVFVVFGPEPLPQDDEFPGNFNLEDINGDNGFRINGHRSSDRLGAAVASLGDFNADTFDDILIGAPFFNPTSDLADAGAGYVIFGRDTPFPVVDFDVTLLNGANGVRFDGMEAAARAGSTVSAAGDLNSDSRQDAVIGAQFSAPGGRIDAGIAYVALGAPNYPHPFALSRLNGVNGFIVHGAAEGDQLGTASAAGGDVNNDGVDDLLVGAWAADPGGRARAGTSYVIFGHAAPFTNPLVVSSLNGTNGFALDGIDADDRSGFAVTGAFDFDGDSRDDLLIGALKADPGGLADAGESYLIRGYTNLQAPVVTITEPADGVDVAFGTPVDFAATVTDDEAGLAADLVWTSDVDGLLGTGAMITVPALSLGFHTVTAAVDDSFFLSGDDSVQVSVFDGGCPLSVEVSGPISGTQTIAAIEEITVLGDARITATGNLTLRAGQSVTFAPGFSTANGGRLRVIMTSNPCP